MPFLLLKALLAERILQVIHWVGFWRYDMLLTHMRIMECISMMIVHTGLVSKRWNLRDCNSVRLFRHWPLHEKLSAPHMPYLPHIPLQELIISWKWCYMHNLSFQFHCRLWFWFRILDYCRCSAIEHSFNAPWLCVHYILLAVQKHTAVDVECDCLWIRRFSTISWQEMSHCIQWYALGHENGDSCR